MMASRFVEADNELMSVWLLVGNLCFQSIAILWNFQNTRGIKFLGLKLKIKFKKLNSTRGIKFLGPHAWDWY